MAEYKKVKFYYDAELATLLGNKIQEVYPEFDHQPFVSKVSKQVDTLEYKARVSVFASELRSHLPRDYRRAVTLLMEVLGPENAQETGMFTEGYWISPIACFIEKYGLNDRALSMRAMAEVTKRHTSEYAIRPYLETDQEKTLKQMIRWSRHQNFHLRRLASEGVRPRLPWAKMLPAFVEDPLPIIPVLENLKDDKIKYVQKSVANCINDILKDNVAMGLKLLTKWASENPTAQTKWIIKHSLRKLRKNEDKRALKILARIS